MNSAVNILECQNISKSYGGLMAVKNVSFSIKEGEIYAIAGPNGAGKTTLFDVISAFSPLTEGKILFFGKEIQGLSLDEICRLGLTRTFQTTVAFSSLNVLTNVLVGATFGRSGRGNPVLKRSIIDINNSLKALEICDLLDVQSTLAGQLPIFAKKRLMLATALVTEPKLLLLDEPVAGLNQDEREKMINLVKKINQMGITILLIEHVMKAVQALAGRMMILYHGEKISEGSPAEVLRDPRVIEVYLGSHGKALIDDKARRDIWGGV